MFEQILSIGFSTPAKTDYYLCYTSDGLVEVVPTIKGFVFS